MHRHHHHPGLTESSQHIRMFWARGELPVYPHLFQGVRDDVVRSSVSFRLQFDSGFCLTDPSTNYPDPPPVGLPNFAWILFGRLVTLSQDKKLWGCSKVH